MTPIKRMIAMAVASLTLALAYVPEAEAQHRGWGSRGGVRAHAMRPYRAHAIRPHRVHAMRPYYGGPRYGYGGYGGPRYGYRRGWSGGNVAGAAAAGLLGAALIGSVIATQQPQCYRELAGYDRSGRPFYYDVCN